MQENPQKHWLNYAMRDGLQTVNRGGRQSVTRLNIQMRKEEHRQHIKTISAPLNYSRVHASLYTANNNQRVLMSENRLCYFNKTTTMIIPENKFWFSTQCI